ncbi:mechanosensitive ion channel family protein [Atopococcus tabaci]|uniref:mechanosensitive ion channel family protein n=1 Tax=Atopococcus tabaci TaxID=269774 RepID=UPI00240A456A|nr:mechanosensitive ion channel family protein [Atopococcus tabaci]
MGSSTDSSMTEEIVDKVAEETNFFIEFLDTIDWQSFLVSFIAGSIKILFSLLLFWGLKKIGGYLIDLAFKQYTVKRNAVPNRYNTLYNVSKNVFHAILGFFTVYTVLEIIGIPVGTLLAGAGVIGLALSLGAQGFVSDVVNGFMILLEKQLDIGDNVTIGDVSGTVLDVNLKTTQVKDFDGTVHYIPNREILVVSNKSRSDMRVRIQIRLFPGTDLENVRKIMEQVNAELVPQFPEITTPPSTISFVPVGNGQMAAQVIMYTENGKQWDVNNTFFEEYIEALSTSGVELPAINYDFNAQ